MAGRTAQGLMQPDLRLGLVTRAGQQAILRQPDQGPGRFLGRCVGVQAGCVFVQGTPCRQVAIRASDAHATPQTRADSASAWYSHSRAKSRLAARKRGVPVHEEPQRRVGQALATRQLPRRFLPLQPREIHPAGIASVPAGDVRIHAPGWRGRRRPTAAPAAAARATARCACRPRAVDAAGCWHCIRCSGRPRPAGAPTWARTVRSRGTAPARPRA